MFDEGSWQLAANVVTPRYLDAAAEAQNGMQCRWRSILAQRRMPDMGMSDAQVERIVMNLSMMDSNNFPGHCGAGEREGRVLSSLVAKRHYHMSHGIGRSGDLMSDQPKACGSSLLNQVANAFVLDAIRLSGFRQCPAALIVPMATGMTLALVLQAVRRQRPEGAKYVIWPRIDQKTSLKCIESAGLIPVPVELSPSRSIGGADHDNEAAALWYRIDPQAVAARIEALGAANIVCVLSTCSCFAPRVPDDPLAMSRVCTAAGVPLVINNAYGVQSRWIMKRLSSTFETKHHAIAAIVQSTDKNFLVPVGGAVVTGTKLVVQQVSDLYAGRASAGPSLDIFITLLSLGQRGWTALLDKRARLVPYLKLKLKTFAEARGETMCEHPHNEISFAVTMRTVSNPVEVGAALFRHRVTGPKVVVLTESKKLCNLPFDAYGSHSNDMSPPRCAMLVLAAALGMETEEVDLAFERLESCWAVAESRSAKVVISHAATDIASRD